MFAISHAYLSWVTPDRYVTFEMCCVVAEMNWLTDSPVLSASKDDEEEE
jgi:hypothetical protein